MREESAVWKTAQSDHSGQIPRTTKRLYPTCSSFTLTLADILLSLVRTYAVGHLRDIRRLVVAMSRARLGLYVFCKKSLFENCYELTNTFSVLNQRPSTLHLVEGEVYPQSQRLINDDVTSTTVRDVVHMGEIVSSMVAAHQEMQQRLLIEQLEEQKRLQQQLKEEQMQQEKMQVEQGQDGNGTSTDMQTEEAAADAEENTKEDENSEDDD